MISTGYNKMRTPVIALDYKDKHKAVPKELMVDYTTGNIYVVSATDKSIIFDVTSKILDQLDSVKGENVKVYIEGIGEIKLTDYLTKVNVELSKSIKAHSLTDEVSYIHKQNVIDNKSIDILNNDIQLKGFRKAEPGTFPVKDKHGNIEWVKLFADSKNGGNSNVGGIFEKEPGDKGSIIGPSNPDNGSILESDHNAPYNGKVYLRASRRQITREPYENLTVILPKAIIDQYSEIQWMVLTSAEFAPELVFEGSIYWDNSKDTQPCINSHNLYTFKTWTGGDKWIATTQSYNNEAFTSITSTYLDKHYFTKDEITDGYYNKAHIDENFYDKDGTDNKIDEYGRQDNTWEEKL